MNKRGIVSLRLMAICVPILIGILVPAVAYAQSANALVLRLNHGVSISSITRDYGLIVEDSIVDRDVYEVKVKYQAFYNLINLMLNFDPRVIYSEQESSISAPEITSNPFHMSFDESVLPRGYRQQQAYTQVSATISDIIASTNLVVVAVLDTGVDFTHPALQGRLLSGYNAIDSNSPPFDIPNANMANVAGHGTMTAGIIARLSSHAVIMPVKVLDANGNGTIMNVVQGIHFAVINNASVINMSFSTVQRSTAIQDAIKEARGAGVVMVASAGNEGKQIKTYPASYHGVLGVGSVEADNTLSPFSNFGPSVKVVAPGSGIRSTFWQDDYATWSGTSFAAPFVSGEAAEILALHPSWLAPTVNLQILSTATSIDSSNPDLNGLTGSGLINYQAATTSP